MMDRSVPIPTLHLFPVLNELLTDLLKSLSPEDWNKPTTARNIKLAKNVFGLIAVMA